MNNQLKHDKKDLETAGCAYCKNALHVQQGEYYIPNANNPSCKVCGDYINLQKMIREVNDNTKGTFLDNITGEEIQRITYLEAITRMPEP